MKKYALLILICCINSYILAQHTNLEKINNYYKSLNKDILIDSLLNINVENYKASYSHQVLNVSVDSVIQERNEELINIRNDSSIIILVPILENTENYTFEKDIYNFLCIDPTDTQIRYYDEKNGMVIILSRRDFLDNYKHYGKELFDLRKAINLIRKEKNVIWLLGSGTIFSDFNYKSGNTNYLFLKNEKIYVYRSKYKDIYELNEFVRKFFNEKKFKKRAIFEFKSRTEPYMLVGNKK